MEQNEKIYVWATDKFLSGWGVAEGKIHKQVAVCDNWDEADKIIAGFTKSNDFKSVGYSTKKPSWNQSRYTSTFRPGKEWTRFVKPQNA